MIKAFVIKYYVYISIVIMCLLSVGMTFKSYQLSLERYNNKVLVAEKTTLTNSLADATERQQIIIKALKENYKTISEKREKEYEKNLRSLENDYTKSKSDVSGLYVAIDNLRGKISNPSTTREEIEGYVSNYETISKECSGEYIEMARDAEEMKNLVIDLDLENDNLRSIVQLHNELNK